MISDDICFDVGVLALSLVMAQDVRYLCSDCTSRKLAPADLCLVATDGLWDVLTDDDAIKIVREAMSVASVGGVPEWNPSSQAAKQAAELLLQEAESKGSTDNITAVVVGFKWDP